VVAVGVYGGDVDAGVVGEVEGDAASVGGPVGEEAGDVGEPLLVAAVGVGRPDAVVAQFGVEPCEADPPVGRLVACCCWQGAAQHGQYDGQSNRQGFGAHLGLPSPGVCAGHCGPPVGSACLRVRKAGACGAHEHPWRAVSAPADAGQDRPTVPEPSQRLPTSRESHAVAVLLRHHPEWQPRQLEIAAAGGADRRSAKNADRPMNQSREAHLAAWPLHSPRGGPVGRGFCG
jgi:hypothetical protein